VIKNCSAGETGKVSAPDSRIQVDVLVLHRSPKTLDEDVVEGASSAIHADRDALALQHTGKRVGRELGALVAVEDLGLPVQAQGFLETVDAEVRLHGVAEPPAQHLAAVPVDDRDEEAEAPSEPDVRDVGAPDLVGPGDRNAPQQVRRDLVLGVRTTGVRARRDRRQPHAAHEALDALAVDRVATGSQLDHHASAPVERPPRVDLIDKPAEQQVGDVL